MTPEEECRPELPPPPRPGYAPRLCTHGPAHWAIRMPDVEGVAWWCTECGLMWRTNGEEVL